MIAVESQRAIGALLGSAIGDALGAPFEFGSAGQFTRRFPKPALGPSTEMVGGGGFNWAPGEFTDDTQMAMILAESLLANGGLDGADVFSHFQVWAETAGDVGNQTRAVLSGDSWQHAATRHFEATGHAAGNGSLMRATTAALFSVGQSIEAAFELARAQSALTHGDPAAGWGAALYHGMVRAAVRGESALDALPALLDRLPPPHMERYRAMLMSDIPVANEPVNGSVWTCLAEAVRVLRRSTTFEGAMRAVCDVGGDVDTVACVTGGLAGATFGVQSVPSRWMSAVHGSIEGRTYRNRDLQRVALALIGRESPPLAPNLPARGPTEIRPGIFAADLLGALRAPADTAVLSLCRVEHQFLDRQYRREFFLIDQEHANPGLDAVLSDALAEIDAFRAAGIPVVVHCHAGESRTSFLLRAWIMRHEHVDANEATVRLRAVWPHVNQHNADFEQALHLLVS